MSELGDKVACAVCGKRMSAINNRHLASHGLTAEAYKAAYPEAPLLSPASAAKLSARSVKANADRKGKPRSESALLAIREGIAKRASRKGIARGPMPETVREKISAAKRAAFAAGATPSRLGAVLSEDTKQKISASLTGRTVGPEAARKALQTKQANGYNLAFFTGRQHSPETRAAIGERSTAFFDRTRVDRRAPMLERIARSNLELRNPIESKYLELRCTVCAHEFTRTPQNFHPCKWQPEICDRCFPVAKVSQMEAEVADLIASLVPDDVVARNDRRQLDGRELDIYVERRQLAVEFCGLYWHSDVFKDPFYHQDKWRDCRDNGIKLLTIFEDEWVNRRSVVEGMLRNALGQNTTRIGARQCVLVRFTSRQDIKRANAFLDANHIQGAGRASAHYGLVHEGDIVSVMTFSDLSLSRKRRGWEINRFASLLGTTVSGAASRLFKAFVEAFNPPTVISYADLRWGSGSVYGSIGFVQDQRNPVPGYWYFAPNSLVREHRYNYRAQNGETERMIIERLRLSRIYDAGNALWVWTNPSQGATVAIQPPAR